MDTHLTNTSTFAELMGIKASTLHHWYKDCLSGFEPEGRKEIHHHDFTLHSGNKKEIIEIPIVLPDNVGRDMAIDEKLIGNDFYTIFTNRKTGKIAFCGATTSSKRLEQAMLPIAKELAQVETITRDLSPSYARLCSTMMPAAVQVADKFHVIKNLMEANNAVRVRYRQEILEKKRKALAIFKEEERVRRFECEKTNVKFKAGRFSYMEEKLANGETLSEVLSRSHLTLYKMQEQWTIKQKRRVEILFENFPDIAKAYNLSCLFRTWYDKKNVGAHYLQIEKGLYDWYEQVEIEDIDEMLNFKAQVEANEEIIRAYFVRGNTNAIAENLNKRIKQFIASNNGVKDVDFFFFRIKNFFASTSN